MTNNPFIERAADDVLAGEQSFIFGDRSYIFRFPNGYEVHALDPGDLAEPGWGPWVVTVVDRRDGRVMSWPDLHLADVRDRLYAAATSA